MFSGQFGNSGPLGLQLLQLGGDASRKLWVALFSQLLSSLVNVVHVLLQRLNVISQRLRSPKSKAITLVFDKTDLSLHTRFTKQCKVRVQVQYVRPSVEYASRVWHSGFTN